MKKKKIFIFFSVIMIFVISFGFVGVHVGAATSEINQDVRNWPMPSDWEQYNYNLLNYDIINDKQGNVVITTSEDRKIKFNTNNVVSNIRANIWIYRGTSDFLPLNKELTLKGNPLKGDLAFIKLQTSTGLTYFDKGEGVTFTLTEHTNIEIYISIFEGYILNNVIFEPMLYVGTDNKSYQPNLNYLVDKVGEEAFNVGYQVGFEEGKKESYLQGFDAGFKQGKNEGYQEGIQENLSGSLGGIFKGASYQASSLDNVTQGEIAAFFDSEFIINGFNNELIYNAALEFPAIIENNQFRFKIFLKEGLYNTNDIKILTQDVIQLSIGFQDGQIVDIGRLNHTSLAGDILLDLSSYSELPNKPVSLLSFVFEVKDSGKFIKTDTVSINTQYLDGYNIGFNVGRGIGYNNGYNEGYNLAISQGADNPFKWLGQLGVFFGDILALPLFGKFTIGGLILIPLIFSVVALLLGLFKKGGK